MSDVYGSYVAALKDQIKELENARLRQQRDAANAQLDFIISMCEEDLGLSEHLGIDIITTIKSLK